jgi:2-polyprenyl-3-methyl-5-hydroxy-6-metoxy-1,4-benzoquinol methylase
VTDIRTELRTGERFAFGANWTSFERLVDEERIAAAVASLSDALPAGIAGRTFLDVGCGSGLMSLAATRLGARVHSFDYDPEAVTATTNLRGRFASEDAWTVESGSILDAEYTRSLGRFDIVYSWGVLHHTGDLWTALDNAVRLVAPGGSLFVAIYNDQGLASRVWYRVKARYNRSGRLGRLVLIGLSLLYLGRHWPIRRLLRSAEPRRSHRTEAGRTVRVRGMSRRHDLVDWVGGYPFEVARPEAVFRFVRDRGFELRHIRTCGGGLGCNEFVFERVRGE